MNPRLFILSMILVGFALGCSESAVDPIIAAPPITEGNLQFKAFVKNAGMVDAADPIEVTGSAFYYYRPMTEENGEWSVVPMQELTLRVSARLEQCEGGTCFGEVSCQGCQTISFRDQPSVKIIRRYAVPAIAPDADLVLQFTAVRGSVTFSHAWIEYAE